MKFSLFNLFKSGFIKFVAKNCLTESAFVTTSFLMSLKNLPSFVFANIPPNFANGMGFPVNITAKV